MRAVRGSWIDFRNIAREVGGVLRKLKQAGRDSRNLDSSLLDRAKLGGVAQRDTAGGQVAHFVALDTERTSDGHGFEEVAIDFVGDNPELHSTSTARPVLADS